MISPSSPKKILILGATSAIAQETARCFAAQGAHLYLVARDPKKLEILAQDLKVYGASQVQTEAADLSLSSSHPGLLDRAEQALGALEIVFLAYGTLADQRRCEANLEEMEKEIQVNLVSVLSLLTLLANRLEKQRSGQLAVITSVAGDRGRGSNYVYGTCKGAVSLFLQGLRCRLYEAGVSVLTIKPGLVDTPMTADLPKNFLFASPQKVGRGIYKAILKKKEVVYLPWFWRGILQILRAVPEVWFKQLGRRI